MIRRVASALVSLALSVTPVTAWAETVNVGPSDEWCAAIGAASPGDEIVLAPGRYTSPCVIRAAGSAGAEIVVRGSSAAAGSESIFDYDGASSNVIDFDGAAAFVVLRDLFWDPTQPDIDAIKIKAGHDLTIEGCTFTGIGGISISANSADVDAITVRGNVFRDLEATGMYFGCHDGDACHATNVLVEANLIDGVDSAAVGYGLEVKLNSVAVIRDNTVYDTKGPGLMVYGSNRGDPPSILEGNYVEGSRNDGAIVVGGGPAIVRNNVTLGGALGGIVAQDYGGRGLQEGVIIVHNTSFANTGPSIRVQSWAADAGNVIAGNALGSAMEPAAPEGTVVYNVVCDVLADCFVGAGGAPYDLWPAEGGPLIDAAGDGGDAWSPTDDFMGVVRGSAPDAGAFERVATISAHGLGGGEPRPPRGAIVPGMDGGTAGDAGTPTDAGGALPGDGGGTGRRDAATGAGGSTEDGGCGCAAATPGSSLGALLVLLALFVRRRGKR